MKFKTSDRCNLFSCTQHFHFCQWNGKQNDKRLKTYWWDYGGMNGCYHVFPKFTFWSRNNDDPKKSRGVVGRGLGWRQLGLIPPILGSSMVIPPKSHQTKYLEVYYKTAEPRLTDHRSPSWTRLPKKRRQYLAGRSWSRNTRCQLNMPQSPPSPQHSLLLLQNLYSHPLPSLTPILALP